MLMLYWKHLIQDGRNIVHPNATFEFGDIAERRCRLLWPSGQRPFTQQQNVCLTFFRARQGDGAEEEEWYLTWIRPLLVQVSSLIATSRKTIG